MQIRKFFTTLVLTVMTIWISSVLGSEEKTTVPSLRLQLTGGIYGIAISFDLSLAPEPTPRRVHVHLQLDDMAFWRSEEIPGTKIPQNYTASWEWKREGYLPFYTWHRVQLSRKGTWREQIVIQSPTSPGIHRLTIRVYTGGKLPEEYRRKGSIPQQSKPVVSETIALKVPDIAPPCLPGEALLSSIPLGARVYVARQADFSKTGFDELFTKKHFKGITPLKLNLQPGKYFVGYELLGVSKETRFEDDGNVYCQTALLQDNTLWYRRVYSLQITDEKPSVLIGLFQLLDGNLCDALYLLPQSASFPISAKDSLIKELNRYGVTQKEAETLLSIVERGGKGLWKEEYGPLPWLFKDKYIKLILQWLPDGSVQITPVLCCSDARRFPTLSLRATQEELEILEKILVNPEALSFAGFWVGSFRPIYKVFKEWPIVKVRRRDGSLMSEQEKRGLYTSILAEILAVYLQKKDWMKVADTFRQYLSGDFLRFVLMTAEAMSEGNSNFPNLAALPLNTIAIGLAEEVFPHKDFLGLAYLQRGLIYNNPSEPDRERALESFKTALSYFAQRPTNYRGVVHAEVEIGNLLASWYAQFTDALTHYARALKIAEEQKLEPGVLGIIAGNIAQTCLVMGQYEKALELGEEWCTLISHSPYVSLVTETVLIPAALALGRYHLAVKIADRDLAWPAGIPTWKVDARAIEARAKLDEFLSLEEVFLHYRTLGRYNLVQGLLGLGRVWLKNGDLARALICLQEALQHAEGSGRLEILVYLAHVYALSDSEQNFSQIRAEIADLLADFADVSVFRPLCARAYRNLGYDEFVLERYNKALDDYRRAIDLDMEMGSYDDLWRDYFLMGLLLEKTGNIEEALHYYGEAINTIEDIRATLEKDISKRLFLYARRIPYEKFIMNQLKKGNSNVALIGSERCRARTLLDLLAKGPIGTLENVVEAGIRAGVVKAEEVERDVNEVIKELPQDTAVLEYFVTERATYVWVIRRGKIEGPVELPHGREALLEEIIKTRKALEDQTNLIVNRYLAELYDWLIRPLEDLLPEGGDPVPHLVIIPSGPLWYLPFQALLRVSLEGRYPTYLIQDYTISYAPSLSVLKYAWLNKEKAYPKLCFLGVADPDPKDSSISRLPEAREEAKEAAKAFPCHELYFDREATEEVVQSRSSVFRHLLISTHGLFNPVNPMFSFLLLSPTQTTDGKLHAYEVFGLELGAETVVLSACETLLPSLRKAEEEEKAIRGLKEGEEVELSPKRLEELTMGDEIVGLTRAFFSAGAASVVSTLWSVPSKATRELMVDFYKGLEEGMDKASALREAQLAVLRNRGWEHPYFWAAFCLSGDWGTPLLGE
ncbi:MAG: hypothetical protein DRG33_00980 [Deltaproteobacteria bacterium]|nr:MAG: hypothetical protein DRG33_00980 [Deltaproteobacteria bacterium]